MQQSQVWQRRRPDKRWHVSCGPLERPQPGMLHYQRVRGQWLEIPGDEWPFE